MARIIYLFALFCVISAGPPRCTQKSIKKTRQRALVGFVEYALSADTFKECLKECLDAYKNYGFICRSGMIYHNTKEENCFLNAENKDAYPLLFANETEGRVDYFEPCKKHVDWSEKELERIQKQQLKNQEKSSLEYDYESYSEETSESEETKSKEKTKEKSEKSNSNQKSKSKNKNDENAMVREPHVIKNQKGSKEKEKSKTTDVSKNNEKFCKDDHTLVSITSDMVLLSSAEHVVDAKTFSDCFESCRKSRDLFDFECRSAMMYYENMALNCMLNFRTAKERPDLFREAGAYKVDYFEPGCGDRELTAPDENIKICHKPFDRVPYHVLVGYAEAVMDAKDIWECIDKCRYAIERYSFNCLSGMFFEEGPGNCIMNSETAKTQPGLYAEDRGPNNVVYFEAPC